MCYFCSVLHCWSLQDHKFRKNVESFLFIEYDLKKNYTARYFLDTGPKTFICLDKELNVS